MKKQISALSMSLMVLLSGCESCQPGPAAGDTSAADTEVFDTQPGSDSSVVGVDSADVDAIDTADVPGDVTNPAAGVCDKDLPKPGEPCEKVGEVRCTNVGVIDDPGDFIECYRPNSVICTTDGSGIGGYWKLAPCDAQVTACAPAGTYCASGVTGAKCVPHRLQNNHKGQMPGALLGNLSFTLCEGKVGLEACAPAWPARCTTFDQLTPAGKEAVLAVLPPCTSSLSDVPYLFPSALCPPDELYCKSIPGTGSTPPQQTTVYLNKCVIDKVSGKPRCAKTCEDMGIKEVW